ncbi:N-acetyl-gamma-glutamyl-phosphate reductase [Pelagibacteraceae bacterium]|nr:N-acetyl-gamma-glutamyl-phosphate reductase [Pelagibacteraceae bacterium]
MPKKVSVAILGSTGFVGLELIKILSNHPNVNIDFFGTENNPNIFIKDIEPSTNLPNNPQTTLNENFDYSSVDTVFLALPHGVSHKYVKLFFNKLQIIDLSADFRLDDIETYKKNYNEKHSAPNLLNEFLYGLAEINKDLLINKKNIAIPGCYPTSVLLPLTPLLQKNLISTKNIIIDAKSGYSGAGKKFDLKNLKNSADLNFYNYNTNSHRHICEIRQELRKYSKSSDILFSFNPHILPNFRGMMSTIYCDLLPSINKKDVIKCLDEMAVKNQFISLVQSDRRVDFFSIQNTNNCLIKIFDHYDSSKIIIVSLIDNLIKGAAGQAVQCFNLSQGFEESTALTK